MSTDRYPEDPVAVDRILDALTALPTWSPPAGALRPTEDDRARLDRYHHSGWLSGADHRMLRELLERDGAGRRFQHGDPLPSNSLVTSGGCVLIDWEFAGYYLPGRDYALLRILLGHVPHAQARIAEHITAHCLQVPFLVNRALLLREQRIHAELPATAWRSRRLALLRSLWTAVSAQFHAATLR